MASTNPFFRVTFRVILQVMKMELQTVYLGRSTNPVQRRVRAWKDRPELGIQEGYIEHKLERIHVWRPSNPVGLGKKSTWTDGRWRNMYEVEMPIAPLESEDFHASMEIEIGGAIAILPAAKLRLTEELTRHLRQHLR